MNRATALARAFAPTRAPAYRTPASTIRCASGTAATASTTTSSQSATSTDDGKSYFVHRTAGQQLPVYQKTKHNGTQHVTRVQKVTGTVEDLKSELQQALGIAADSIKINPTNRHILIKGLVKKQVAAYLEQQRF